MAGVHGELRERTVLKARYIAVLAGSFCFTAAPAMADDGPIHVHGGRAWIDSQVRDPGAPASPGQRRRPHGPRRTCTQRGAGGYASPDEFTGDYPVAGPGGWVIRRCSDGSMAMAYVPAPVASTAAAVQRLAREATNRLPLPPPSPKFNPARPSSAGPATLVEIPTWFWVEGWKPIGQRTQAGEIWAQVTATPVAMTWYPGDGSAPMRCDTNTPWTPNAAGTRCEHTYVRSSAGQAGQAYPARVVVSWQVSWTGSGGRSGTLPLMQRQTTFSIAVAERQTVVTVGGNQ
jgi:hypothetical protein